MPNERFSDEHYDKLAQLEMERGRIQAAGFMAELSDAGLVSKTAGVMDSAKAMAGRARSSVSTALHGTDWKPTHPGTIGATNSMTRTVGAIEHARGIGSGVRKAVASGASRAVAHIGNNKALAATAAAGVGLAGVGAYRAGKGRRAEGAALGPAGVAVKDKLTKSAKDRRYDLTGAPGLQAERDKMDGRDKGVDKIEGGFVGGLGALVAGGLSHDAGHRKITSIAAGLAGGAAAGGAHYGLSRGARAVNKHLIPNHNVRVHLLSHGIGGNSDLHEEARGVLARHKMSKQAGASAAPFVAALGANRVRNAVSAAGSHLSSHSKTYGGLGLVAAAGAGAGAAAYDRHTGGRGASAISSAASSAKGHMTQAYSSGRAAAGAGLATGRASASAGYAKGRAMAGAGYAKGHASAVSGIASARTKINEGVTSVKARLNKQAADGAYHSASMASSPAAQAVKATIGQRAKDVASAIRTRGASAAVSAAGHVAKHPKSYGGAALATVGAGAGFAAYKHQKKTAATLRLEAYLS